MHVRIVTFRLTGLSHDQFERHCVQIADRFAGWPGLVAKVWLADRPGDTFGGVYVFESAAAADASRRTPEFAAMTSNPRFSDLRIQEFDTLDAPTAVTAPHLAAGTTADR